MKDNLSTTVDISERQARPKDFERAMEKIDNCGRAESLMQDWEVSNGKVF